MPVIAARSWPGRPGRIRPPRFASTTGSRRRRPKSKSRRLLTNAPHATAERSGDPTWSRDARPVRPMQRRSGPPGGCWESWRRALFRRIGAPTDGIAINRTRNLSITYELRNLSDAEIDAVAGGYPVGAFAAGVVVGAGSAGGTLALGAGAVMLVNAVSDLMNDEKEGGTEKMKPQMIHRSRNSIKAPGSM